MSSWAIISICWSKRPARISVLGCKASSRVMQSPKRILAAVADYYDVEPALLAKRHDPHMARAVAAWLCRRHTEATLANLAEWLGLSRADSVPNLTRRRAASRGQALYWGGFAGSSFVFGFSA